MARFADGLAVDADLIRAAERALGQALDALPGVVPTLACVFVCGDDPTEVEAAGERVAGLLPGTAVLGCSAHGVIGAAQGAERANAVSVWLASLPGAALRSFHLEVMRTPEGMAIVGMPEPRADDQVTILLADPYSFPADGFVEQADEVLGGIPIVGALAAGFRGPGSTRLFLDGRVLSRGAVGITLGGHVAVRPIVSQGCRPVGPSMVVTRSEDNAVLELAGMSALSKLEQIVEALPPEEQALVSSGLQFGIAMDEYAEEHEYGDFLIRGVLGVDRERGAVLVGDVVDVGRTVRFQVRDAEAADVELVSVLERFRREGGLGHIGGALLVSCNGRGAALFASADHDVLAVRRGLGVTAVGGLFAGGEIGPVGGRNHVHGFTASILAFGA